MHNFDHTHYIPILRWKQAERLALRGLYTQDAARLTPLIEVVPSAGGDPSGQRLVSDGLLRVARDIASCWGAKHLFVDFWLLPDRLRTPDGRHPLTALAHEARGRGLSLIPVTGLDRDSDYQAAVSSMVALDGRGVCARLLDGDLLRSDLAPALGNLLSRLRVPVEEARLLLDRQFNHGDCAPFPHVCRRVPFLARWRTFSVATGAFPKDLTEFEKNRQHTLPRLDWLSWKETILSSPRLPRLPAFSDYTIQHPLYEEPLGFLNFSGSIRYTHEEYWVIMRGEGVFNHGGPGFMQFPANAQLLCERAEFCGPDFSKGDEYIYQMGSQLVKTGNASTWLQAGINHHLTFVVRQIAGLFGTAAAPAL